MSILDSLIETGGVTEAEILKSLHVSGVVDVVKLIAETIKTKASGATLKSKADVRKIKEELISLLDIVEELIEDEYEESEEDRGGDLIVTR